MQEMLGWITLGWVSTPVDSQGTLAGLLRQCLCFWRLQHSELTDAFQLVGHETRPRSQKFTTELLVKPESRGPD